MEEIFANLEELCYADISEMNKQEQANFYNDLRDKIDELMDRQTTAELLKRLLFLKKYLLAKLDALEEE